MAVGLGGVSPGGRQGRFGWPVKVRGCQRAVGESRSLKAAAAMDMWLF